MNKTYKFYGIERSNDWQIGAIAFGVCTFLSIYLFKLNLDYGYDYLGLDVQFILIFIIIAGFFISTFVLYTFLFKKTIEYWEINYDKTNLYICSNKRDKITIPFTELIKLRLIKEKTRAVVWHAIQFELPNDKLRIDVRVTIGNILCRKKDLLVFYKFYTSLFMDVIRYDYIITHIRSQIVRPTFNGIDRLPAIIIFARKPE
ncbi:hypothetical protein RCS94_05805 [Orbaceae bacterium ac157xtp]